MQAQLAQWNAVDDASEASSSAATTTQGGEELARENLQRMLFLNLLELAEMFARQLEQLDLEMQQSLLEHPATPPEEPPALPMP